MTISLRSTGVALVRCVSLAGPSALLCCWLASANAQAPAGSPPGGAAWLGQRVTDAKLHDLRVFATGALQSSLDPTKAQADQSVGKHVVIQYGAARADLRDQILMGQSFEVAILVPDVNDELVQKGLAQTQRFEIARLPVGIGYAGDVPAPDISTAAGLKKTLLGATAVNYSPAGLGAQTATKIFAALDIADAVRRAPPGQSIPLGPGEYSIAIFPASEILANKNLKYIGPVIDDFQIPLQLQAVIGTQARDAKAAKAFIDFLRSPAFATTLERNGMEVGK